MPVTGPLSHLDLSVGDPDHAIPFYAALLEAIGFTRFRSAEPGWSGDRPTRAAWFIRYADGAMFGIDLRPCDEAKRGQRYDRQAPGPHHVAFHAASREAVDGVHENVRAVGGTVLDAPAEYTGPAYGGGYYAVFFADPDGVKLEVVHHPPTNPATGTPAG